MACGSKLLVRIVPPRPALKGQIGPGRTVAKSAIHRPQKAAQSRFQAADSTVCAPIRPNPAPMRHELDCAATSVVAFRLRRRWLAGVVGAVFRQRCEILACAGLV